MISLLIPVFWMLSVRTHAGPGDTTVVQAFTFGSPQDAWFVFPPADLSCEKVLMLYTLKCNPAQNPACGEWDYLTYTYLYDHTGLLDSSVVHQPCFLVNGQVMDTLHGSLMPTYQVSGRWQYSIIHTDTTFYSVFDIGSADSLVPFPLQASEPVSRTFVLWRASELITAGLTAGPLSGIGLHLKQTGSLLKDFTIRLKPVTTDSLGPQIPDGAGFTECYAQHTGFADTSWAILQFVNPFNWDGTSNILAEFSFNNLLTGSDYLLSAEDAGFKAVMTRACSDRAAGFSPGSYVDAPVNSAFQGLDSVVTVSFLAYGNPLLQPQDGTCFEGVDAGGNRVLNVHLPWSNSNIYWDAGNSGSSYDRINKAATLNETEGKWNHWTFTKNITAGTLKIYCNGVLWHSGSGMNRLLQPIDRFLIGRGNWGGSQSYAGKMDDFAVFDAELDAATIQQFYNVPLTASHPYYNKLVSYFTFDDGNYAFAADSAPGNHPPAVMIAVDNALKDPSDLVSGFHLSQVRPVVRWEQGVYTSEKDSVWVQDSVMNVPMQIVFYNDSVSQPGVATDTVILWPADYFIYLFDGDSILTGSVYVNPDTSMYLTYYDYFQYFPQVIRYELARYITPYGNGLSLGTGWTWTFDVSDYRTLLSDSVHLAAGNWQELLDMRFLFIEGTPPREVYSVQNLWNGGFNYGQSADPIESHLTPLKIFIPDTVDGVRWKSRITGHGMDTPQNCAEFCPKNHYFQVNGVQQYSRLVWRDNCDLNPLYPQGGTWVYDRSNWCPGAEVWTYDLEITPYCTPGDTLLLDHDVEPYVSTGGWDYYQIEDQLVTYGPPSFTTDAAIVRILAPNTDKMWARMNPVCTRPALVIANHGSAPLTSLKITYGIEGADPSEFQWTGHLGFLEEETVTLDTFAWAQGASYFHFGLSEPNGTTDEYLYNNEQSTPFTYVPVLPATFVVALKTNNNPWENSYTLTDHEGNLILSRDGLAANTQYSDTLTLGEGCYIFRLIDTGEDGLTWWANTGQGSGSMRFRSATHTTQVYKNFGSDFGGEIYYQFTVGLSSGIEEQSSAGQIRLNLFPNPAETVLNIEADFPGPCDGTIEISDFLGRCLFRHGFKAETALSITEDLSDYRPGVYFVKLQTGSGLIAKKIIVP